MQNSSPTGPAVVTAGLEAQILNVIQSRERERDHPAHLPALFTFTTLSMGTEIQGEISAHGSQLLEPTRKLTIQACLPCCRSKQKCDHVRPCTRCIRLGIEVITCCGSCAHVCVCSQVCARMRAVVFEKCAGVHIRGHLQKQVA